MNARWAVWSYDEANEGWVAVDQGGEPEMRAGAERRNAATQRHGAGGAYVALPEGEYPHGKPEPAPEPDDDAGDRSPAAAALVGFFDLVDDIARAAEERAASPWTVSAASDHVRDGYGQAVGAGLVPFMFHVVAHDPGMVLARHVALRRLVERHAACPADCATLTLLADAYVPR